ncbi:hypothetical protein WJX81_004982 [Elliptochloris bilobata]|uniref:beta-galactosidase n=1 Tax=Elliptochloris bilobata TaxID=381761 RepID=A0AAW1RR12_9CHLO
MCAALVGLLCLCAAAAVAAAPTFTIENDRFIKDGKPFQILSGSLHYHRVHPEQWEDRMQRVRALGLNTISVYVPWNLHEPRPGQYTWTGFADLDRFLDLAQKNDLQVLLRPGPYICAEWDFGGFPWWLASSQVAGGRELRLRSDDPRYLAQVDRWWSVLLPRIARHLYIRGGNVLMVQIENEFGFLGPNEAYLRHLLASARAALGEDALIYTTDPPPNVNKGSLYGGDVYSVVDFGAGWFDLGYAFGTQKSFNAPGKSPAMCSEFYTGWLTRWGEAMANTSLSQFITTLEGILSYNDGSGSVNLYMAHGGTNFGYSAGGSIDNGVYWACITSYDYDAPISESGDYGQPGIGGPNKFDAIRNTIKAHTGQVLPTPPPPPHIKAFGRLALGQRATLLSQLPRLYPGDGIVSEQPLVMEEYGQPSGFIVYRTAVPVEAMAQNSEMTFSGSVNDVATVLMDGWAAGVLDRNGVRNLLLPPPAANRSSPSFKASSATKEGEVTLDVVIGAVGRSNQGFIFDTKGLTSPDVFLDGKMLRTWRAFPLPLDNLDQIEFGESKEEPTNSGPTFYRGELEVGSDAIGRDGRVADAYLSVRGWTMGLAFVNGFNLGWYWPSRGPANTMYVPGPLMRRGKNEIILLEVEHAPDDATIEFVATPDFFGPDGLHGALAPHPGAAGRGTFADRARLLTPPALQPAAADANFATT